MEPLSPLMWEMLFSMADSEEKKRIIEMGIIEPLDCSNVLVAETIKSIVTKNYLEKLLDYRHPLGMPYHRMAAQKVDGTI